jgi:hypothetical protein
MALSTQPPSPAEDPGLAEHAALDREEEEVYALRLALPAWLRDNPGLCLTVIYLFASIVGLVFHYLFLKRFGFNVIEFSETSDFLMVVVREPLTVALALLGVPFYAVYMRGAILLGRGLRRRSARLRGTPEKRRKVLEATRRWQWLIRAGFIWVWALAFVMVYSKWRSQQIRDGVFRKTTVEYKTDSPRADGRQRAEGLALLATTSRFVFLYDPATKRSEVVPLDSIARLVWDARTRKEREADAEAAKGSAKPPG